MRAAPANQGAEMGPEWIPSRKIGTDDWLRCQFWALQGGHRTGRCCCDSPKRSSVSNGQRPTPAPVPVPTDGRPIFGMRGVSLPFPLASSGPRIDLRPTTTLAKQPWRRLSFSATLRPEVPVSQMRGSVLSAHGIPKGFINHKDFQTQGLSKVGLRAKHWKSPHSSR